MINLNCITTSGSHRAAILFNRNYARDYVMRAFGKDESPDFAAYKEFLESRCFPRNRDKMKLILEDLDLPFYEPLMIIEKTQGKMAEDDFWIKIET